MQQSTARFVPCIECPLRAKPSFRALSEPGLAFISGTKSAHVVVEPHTDIVEAGQVGAPLMTLFDGWALRYSRGLRGRRHILSILLPGDLIAPEAAIFGRVEHSVMALTPVALCVLGGGNLGRLFAEDSGLALALYRDRLDDLRWHEIEAMNAGTGDALAQVGFVFLHTFDRLRDRGLANGTACAFPLKRADLADRVGLSGMHLNRTLGTLKRQRLATLADNMLHIPKRGRLARLLVYPPHVAMEQRTLL